MSQISQYRSNRPVTASPNKVRIGLSLNSDHSEQIKRFRSEFPNLPGFSRHALLRPQSPKVIQTQLHYSSCDSASKRLPL